MKKAVVMGISAIALAGCGFDMSFDHMDQGEKGSGVAKTETRKVGEFKSVVLTGSPNVDITIGKTQKVEVTADDNLLAKLETTVVDGKLRIGFKDNVNPEVDAKVVIVVAALNGAEVTGSGDMTIKGLEAAKFQAAITGSGSITATGVATDVDAQVTGSGDLKLAGVKAQSAKARVTGSGDIDLSASKSLAAEITGSGDIKYSGNPKVSETILGSGSVSSH